jgi:RNA polymerase sigma factor (TIGR02999 family)
MRRILIDHLRSRERLKRGKNVPNIPLDDVALASDPREVEMLSIDEALTRLAEMDPRKSRIVEMKFFGGMSIEEISEVEQVSTRTIEREWRKAKAWLYDEIK